MSEVKTEEVAGDAPDAAEAAPADATSPGGVNERSNVQFPWRLHELLSEAEVNGNNAIISWVPDANAFKVHNKVRFTTEILPSYFNATKYKSFQRNLNLWGFETMQDGPNKGACYHPLFIRGDREKCHYMNRQKLKGENGKHQFPKTKKAGKGPFADLAAGNPALAGAIKASSLSAEELKGLPFPKKLHHILAQPQYADCLAWTPDGRCIRVVDPFKFQEKVAATYFSHTSFSSFLVELESFGFKKVSHVGFQECYYHDLMIRGCHHLTKYLPDPQESRKFSSEDPSADLVIDPAFGIPSIVPPSPVGVAMPMMGPYMGGGAAMMSHDAAGALVQEMHQRQQLATLQLLAASGGNAAAQMGLAGLNPALLGAGVAAAARRASMPSNFAASSIESKANTKTPISNYLANSSQNSSSNGAGAQAAVIFEIAPGAALLFKFGEEDITEETYKTEIFLRHGRGVIRTLDKAIDLLEKGDMETLAQSLQKLGARHATYDVKYEHFPIVGVALLDTLEKALGDEFTDEVKEAWTGVFGVVTEHMSSGMKEALA